MFTGIIQDVGKITSIDKKGDWTLRIQTGLDLSYTPIGASICCSGCCLTAIEKGTDSGKAWFDVQVSQESLDKTTIRNWEEGGFINLEPSLKMGDELGGHFVFGHVDGIARITDIMPEEDSHRLIIEAPKDLASFIASKGSIALDGISLTVNEVGGHAFGINIIPHTWEMTTIQYKSIGDFMNIEIDMLARYVSRIVEGQKAKEENSHENTIQRTLERITTNGN